MTAEAGYGPLWRQRRPKAEPRVKYEVAPWMAEAACLGKDPAIWFPEKNSGMHAAIEEARAVCLTCPVITECLDYALHNTAILPGVWGGTSERERRALRTQMRKAQQ